jgi:hypothetical protein
VSSNLTNATIFYYSGVRVVRLTQEAHNLPAKAIVGSNPTPATNFPMTGRRFLVILNLQSKDILGVRS